MIHSLTRPMGALILLGVAIVCAHPAMAQTTLFSAGFEASEGYSTTISGSIRVFNDFGDSTTFERAPGALLGQPSSNIFAYNFFNPSTTPLSYDQGTQQAVNSTTVVGGVAASGTQSARIDGTVLGNQRVLYFPANGIAAASNGLLSLSADIQVTNPSATNFGRWGVEASGLVNGFVRSAIAFGTSASYVLASDDGGDTVYAAFNPNTGELLRADYGSFNNYQVQIDYSTRAIRGLFNGSQVGFLPVDLATLTPTGAAVGTLSLSSQFGNRLEYLSFGQAQQNSTETGYFDNFRVAGSNVVVVPESGTLALALPGISLLGAAVIRRRRNLATVK